MDKKLILQLQPLYQNSNEGKYFYKVFFEEISQYGDIVSATTIKTDKYFVFCYVGYPAYMDNYRYDGDKYKEVVMYLKKKIGNKKYDTVHEYCFRIDFFEYVDSVIRNKYAKDILLKISGQDRKDKITKMLGN